MIGGHIGVSKLSCEKPIKGSKNFICVSIKKPGLTPGFFVYYENGYDYLRRKRPTTSWSSLAHADKFLAYWLTSLARFAERPASVLMV